MTSELFIFCIRKAHNGKVILQNLINFLTLLLYSLSRSSSEAPNQTLSLIFWLMNFDD